MNERLLDIHEHSEDVELVPSFARHETFPPRHGWLKKGFDAAIGDPGIFLRTNATTELGVGKNMVRAIRYWCAAYKVLEERPTLENPRLRHAQPTVFGERLLASDGWDPFLEDPASLWLLHWQLLRSPCVAPAWFAIFNRFRASEFTDESLVALLRLFCEGHPEWGEVAENSLLKDARCLLRMYGSVAAGRDLVEDTIDSPFTELDLLRPVNGLKRHYLVNVGPKPSLPAAIVVYAAVDFAVQRRMSSRVMTLSRLAYSPGSPGRAFQLTESELARKMNHFAERSGGIRLVQAAGTRQLVVDEDVYLEPSRLLDDHYGARRRRMGPEATAA